MPIVIKKGGALKRSAPVVEGALDVKAPPPPPEPPKVLDPHECPYCHWKDGKKCDRDQARACFRGLYLVKKPFGSR